ncbi:UPF0420 protein C16orf58 -like protein [Trichinella zimbabwensis]|uniref:UPF0420 protein C16orf58-like protein n=1 Tax=Trichinella zimbabwensis TaxID=268475 RepID=A0A0V1HWJ5_9BILA|nr:UPF0420 protein C16orf58 -like protein [Trichinella zimbabwensis]
MIKHMKPDVYSSEEEKLVEYYGKELRNYCSVFNGETLRLNSASPRKTESGLKCIVGKIFLPQGYPDSVTEDYFDYQCWDSLQAFCSSVTSAFALHAVFKAVGVGNESASLLAATVVWLLRNGVGMMSQIIFAWFCAGHLDSDCKSWRFVADVLNDCSIFLDLIAPLSESTFIYVACLANVCRSIVGVAGGATRAAITQHQSRRHNMADVAAKDSSQETMVNLIALGFNLALLPLVAHHVLLVWTLFLMFTFMHIYANYRAIRALKFATLNEKRFRMLVQSFIKDKTNTKMGVDMVNYQESLVPFALTNFIGDSISLGTSLIHRKNLKLHCFHKADQYFIFVYHKLDGTLQIDISLSIESENAIILEAYFKAEYFLLKFHDCMDAREKDSIFSEALAIFPSFYTTIEKLGWLTDTLNFIIDEWRWKICSEDYSTASTV